jgi:uncharacterized membrane protein YphA (DoxX/SURF4 family)
MALDRQATGLAILRICIGVFFLFESFLKIGWITEPAILGRQLAAWANAAPTGSIAAWYLHRIALPGVAVFARLVPLGEFSCGLALIAGFATPIPAFIAFFMALNFQIASGAIFKYSFLTSGYGLPVLGSTLALAVGGVRLPWSIR